jgi:hypothetical protein
MGTIRSFPSEPQILPSGIRGQAVEVIVADGSQQLLPPAALEALTG